MESAPGTFGYLDRQVTICLASPRFCQSPVWSSPADPVEVVAALALRGGDHSDTSLFPCRPCLTPEWLDGPLALAASSVAILGVFVFNLLPIRASAGLIPVAVVGVAG